MANDLKTVIGKAIGAYGQYKYEEFTANGTFNVPPGARWYLITACGGGGGGGGGDFSSSSDGGGGGGGGGGCYRYPIFLNSELSSTVTVTIGAKGTGGAVTVNGGNGGNTTFGPHLTCAGGSGGFSPDDGTTPSDGGDGGDFTTPSNAYGNPHEGETASGGAGATASGADGSVGSQTVNPILDDPWIESGSTDLPIPGRQVFLSFDGFGGGGGGAGGNFTGGDGGAAGTTFAIKSRTDDPFSTILDDGTFDGAGGTSASGAAGGSGGGSLKSGKSSTDASSQTANGSTEYGGGGSGADYGTNTTGGDGTGGYLLVEWFE